MNSLWLVTTTRSRPSAFAILEHWVSRQTYYQEYTWLVVNDSPPEVQAQYQYNMDQVVIKRPYEPTPELGNVRVRWAGEPTAHPLITHMHSLCANWLEALKVIPP